jgi:cbb3-type cytochrome oxidase subunit 3
MRSDGDVLFRILEEIDFRSGVNFPQVDAAVSRVLDQEAEQTCDPFWIMIGVLLIGQLSFFVLQSVGAFSAPMVFLAEVLLLCILATVYRPLRRQAEEQEALRREILFTLNRHSVTAEHRRRDREVEDTQSIAIKAHSQRRQELDRAAELEFYEDPEVKILP